MLPCHPSGPVEAGQGEEPLSQCGRSQWSAHVPRLHDALGPTTCRYFYKLKEQNFYTVMFAVSRSLGCEVQQMLNAK